MKRQANEGRDARCGGQPQFEYDRTNECKTVKTTSLDGFLKRIWGIHHGQKNADASDDAEPHDRILRLTSIQVAAKLNLADLLKERARTAEELAAIAGVRAPQLYRVLRALASVGVFAETKDRRFKLTRLAATLQTRVPGSMRTGALLLNSDWQWNAWQQLLHGIETDEVPFVKAHGMPVFEYLEKHPEDLAIFHSSTTGLTNPAIVAAYRFSRLRTLVDVGGGHGSLLATILKANPKLNEVLFDRPSVIAGAETADT